MSGVLGKHSCLISTAGADNTAPTTPGDENTPDSNATIIARLFGDAVTQEQVRKIGGSDNLARAALLLLADGNQDTGR